MNDYRRSTVMQMKRDRWLVFVAAHASTPIEATTIRQILEQSDVGGDIECFSAGPLTIALAVAAIADTEQQAYRRVLARVKDALGKHWMVQADPGSAPLSAPVIGSEVRPLQAEQQNLEQVRSDGMRGCSARQVGLVEPATRDRT